MARKPRQLTELDREQIIADLEGYIHAMKRAHDTDDTIKFDGYMDDLQYMTTVYDD